MSAAQVIEKPRVSQELRVASAAFSALGGAKSQRVRMQESDVPSLVPSGASLKVSTVRFQDLKMGDLICVRIGSRLAVRRFVKTKIAKSDTYLLTAREGFGKKEALLRSSLIGRIDGVEFQGLKYDPSKQENVLKKFWGMLTEYGTHKAFGVF